MLTKKRFPIFLFLFLFVSVLFFSCEKEEEALVVLNLQVEKTEDIYHCSWKATNISTFENYYIVYSIFPIEENEDPLDFPTNQRTKIDLQSQDSVSIAIYNPEQLAIYFRLFIDIDTRYIRSSITTVENDVSEVINIKNIDESMINASEDALYFYESFDQKLYYYDYVEKEMKNNAIIDFSFEPNLSTIDDNGFGEEIYTFKSSNLIILDANSMEEKVRLEIDGFINSVTTNGKGLIVLSVRKDGHTIQVVSRDSMTVLNSFSTFNHYGQLKAVKFLSNLENKFAEFGADKIIVFEIDDEGQVISESEKWSSFSPYPSNHFVTNSPLGNYYIHSYNGKVYDTSFNGIKNLSMENGTNTLFFFNEDETILYAYRSSPGSYVHKISTTDFELMEIKNYNYNTPLQMFYRDGVIHLALYSTNDRCVYIRPLDL